MISTNKVVSLHYRLKRDSSEGELIEETFGSNPLTFLYGTGTMIPKFEEEVKNMNVGDKAQFGITATDAYGVRNEEAIVELPIDIFKVDDALDMEMLSIGNVLPMQDGEGNRMDGIILDVTETNVKMDFNHPMAGEDLFFEIEVTEIREATQEEIDHGHVHGEGGHQH